jgi:hypothetical protein
MPQQPSGKQAIAGESGRKKRSFIQIICFPLAFSIVFLFLFLAWPKIVTENSTFTRPGFKSENLLSMASGISPNEVVEKLGDPLYIICGEDSRDQYFFGLNPTNGILPYEKKGSQYALFDKYSNCYYATKKKSSAVFGPSFIDAGKPLESSRLFIKSIIKDSTTHCYFGGPGGYAAFRKELESYYSQETWLYSLPTRNQHQRWVQYLVHFQDDKVTGIEIRRPKISLLQDILDFAASLKFW